MFLTSIVSMSNPKGEINSSTPDVGQQSLTGGAAGAAPQNSQNQRRPSAKKPAERSGKRDSGRMDSIDNSIATGVVYDSTSSASSVGRAGKVFKT